jgi:hypothetical protein
MDPRLRALLSGIMFLTSSSDEAGLKLRHFFLKSSSLPVA